MRFCAPEPFLRAAALTLVFSLVYYVTPDVKHRSFRWVTPGAAIAVTLWVLALYGFSLYLTRVADAGAIYGAFAGAIVLVAWLWLTNVALLFGAELNAVVDLRRAKYLPESYDGPVLPAKEPAEA